LREEGGGRIGNRSKVEELKIACLWEFAVTMKEVLGCMKFV
jgi:hypothetical protein